MNKEQVINLLKRIKGGYGITITEEILKSSTVKGALTTKNKFEPKISDLIKDLKTLEKKEQEKREQEERDYYISKSDIDYERNMRIRYIKKMCNKFSLNINDYFNNIDSMSLRNINERYNTFIWSLVELQSKKHILTGYELIGLRDYYKNVLLKNKMK